MSKKETGEAHKENIDEDEVTGYKNWKGILWNTRRMTDKNNRI